MRRADDKRDFGLVIVLLRAILRWSRPMLSQASGVDEDLIADCERGLSRPIRKNRERLARAFGVEPSFLDELVPVCRSLRLAYERAARGQGPAAGMDAARLEEKVTASILEAMAPYLLELQGLDELASHEPDLTAQINAVCDEIDTRPDPSLAEAARRILHRTEW